MSKDTNLKEFFHLGLFFNGKFQFVIKAVKPAVGAILTDSVINQEETKRILYIKLLKKIFDYSTDKENTFFSDKNSKNKLIFNESINNVCEPRSKETTEFDECANIMNIGVVYGGEFDTRILNLKPPTGVKVKTKELVEETYLNSSLDMSEEITDGKLKFINPPITFPKDLKIKDVEIQDSNTDSIYKLLCDLGYNQNFIIPYNIINEQGTNLIIDQDLLKLNIQYLNEIIKMELPRYIEFDKSDAVFNEDYDKILSEVNDFIQILIEKRGNMFGLFIYQKVGSTLNGLCLDQLKYLIIKLINENRKIINDREKKLDELKNDTEIEEDKMTILDKLTNDTKIEERIDNMIETFAINQKAYYNFLVRIYNGLQNQEEQKIKGGGSIINQTKNNNTLKKHRKKRKGRRKTLKLF